MTSADVYCKAALICCSYLVSNSTVDDIEIVTNSLNVSQHIERDQLSQKIKIDLNGCSFISILVQKILKSDIAFLRYGNFIEDVITDW